MRKYIAMKEMAAGNAVVGEMWKEFKVCDGSTTVKELMEWASEGHSEVARTKNITLATVENDDF